jgi:glycosyltransferase involved in cell wall biosynthesis
MGKTSLRITIVGNFGLSNKATMSARAMPIAHALAELGHQVTVILPADSPDPPALATSDGVRLILLGRGRARSFPGQLACGLRLTSVALRTCPDVLYAFKPKAYAGLSLLAFWLWRQLGLITTTIVLDTDDWEGKGGWADRDHASAWQRLLVSWHERWCLSHADLVTVASRELERLAAAEGATTVYTPNAASLFSPGWEPGDGRAIRESLAIGNRPVVLAYTRFVEFAPRRLVEVFAQIHRRRPEACFLVVGKGLGGEEEEFTQLVSEFGLHEVVHQVGWVPAPELPNYLAAADVAVYLLDDTLLNRAKCLMKLVDLLLAGVPIVADAVGQANEYIQNDKTSLLVSPGDIEAMAQRVVDLLDNPERRCRLGQAARAHLLHDWTWESQAAVVVDSMMNWHTRLNG